MGAQVLRGLLRRAVRLKLNMDDYLSAGVRKTSDPIENYFPQFRSLDTNRDSYIEGKDKFVGEFQRNALRRYPFRSGLSSRWTLLTG